jgi:dTDP-4-dehydrorhamnose 3,5-epimerase
MNFIGKISYNITMIDGVVIKPLKKIPDERGTIYHMVRNDDPGFKQFGEIYFSLVYPGAVKAWHLHTKMVLNYAVIHGMIKLVLYDNRENSPTKGELMELFIGEENYCLVTIPENVWNGFKGIGKKTAIVANCSTIPHDPQEIQRMDPLKNDIITYDWSLKFK